VCREAIEEDQQRRVVKVSKVAELLNVRCLSGLYIFFRRQPALACIVQSSIRRIATRIHSCELLIQLYQFTSPEVDLMLRAILVRDSSHARVFPRQPIQTLDSAARLYDWPTTSFLTRSACCSAVMAG